MMENKIIEHGIDHQDDKMIYRVLTLDQKVTSADGTENSILIKKTYSRDRIIYNEAGKKQVEYSDWTLVE